MIYKLVGEKLSKFFNFQSCASFFRHIKFKIWKEIKEKNNSLKFSQVSKMLQIQA